MSGRAPLTRVPAPSAAREGAQPGVRVAGRARADGDGLRVGGGGPHSGHDFGRIRIYADEAGGRPLPAGLRETLAPHLGSAVAGVRLHGDGASARAADALGAVAFTIGTDVHLGPSLADAPTGTPRAERILLHEIVHAVQQAAAPSPAGPVPAGRGDDRHEREAAAVVSSLAWGSLRPLYDRVTGDRRPGPQVTPPRLRPRTAPHQAQLQLIELTYDDGPDTAGNTQKVLDELRRSGARATFYLVGRRVIEGDNWRIVFDIAASGNWLGNHAFDWNTEKDNHIFLHGSMEERARKILITEWAIRDALIRGRSDAQSSGTWSTIPAASRAYIDDVIAHGTGRFRTPGFKSKWWREDERVTLAALASVNEILAAAGLRELSVSDAVDIDPKDWEKAKTEAEIETAVTGELGEPSESILLHSRVAASAEATPAIVADIQKRGWSFEAPARGETGKTLPRPGFAGLSTISDPPTRDEVRKARKFLFAHLDAGPILLGYTAIGIFQMAQLVGPDEVQDFMGELESTMVTAEHFEGRAVDWLYQNQEFRLLYEFLKVWVAAAPFPKGPGVVY